MKNIFLRTTASDKFYKSYRNIDICFWAEDFSKRNYLDGNKNLSNKLTRGNKLKIYNLSHKISKKITKKIYKSLIKSISEKISYREWEIIFYPFIIILINMIISRKLIIDNFFLKNKYKKITLNSAIVDKQEFEFNSTEDFLKVTNTDKFNNFLILKIIKSIKNINLNIKKIKFKDNSQIKKEFFLLNIY